MKLIMRRHRCSRTMRIIGHVASSLANLKLRDQGLRPWSPSIRGKEMKNYGISVLPTRNPTSMTR